MSVIRAIKDSHNPYIQIPRSIFHDRNISVGAKGVLAFLYTFPDSEKINYHYLLEALNINEKKLNSYLEELVKFGYISDEEVIYD